MYQICRHIKVSGANCGAPALSGKSYCYFHFRAHRQRHRIADPFLQKEALTFTTPLLEDPASIQLAINEVVVALAQNRVECKRAGTLLYGLQLASSIARFEDDIVAEQPVRELCQNAEGEDIAPESTASDPDDEGAASNAPAAEHHAAPDQEDDQEEDDEEEDDEDYDEPEDEDEGSEEMQQAIRNWIDDLAAKHPEYRP